MNARRAKRSLGWDLTFNLILGEAVLALILIFTIGTFSMLNVAQQRAQTIQEVSSVVAAGLMPLLADQEGAQLQAQLESILGSTDLLDIRTIQVVDSSGQMIASHGDPEPCMISSLAGESAPWSVLTKCQLVRQPVVVDGLTVATVYVSYPPVDIREAMVAPGIASLIVLVSVVFVSAPWSAWRFTRVFIEPIQDLRRYAVRIAEGDLDAEVEARGSGEIGELQDTLNRMASQLRHREGELRGSYDELEKAYASLQAAKLEIEKLSALKTDFVAVAAHEIRSPLSTVTLFSDLLESGELGPLEPPSQEAVETISAAAARLSVIATDLMDTALLERGTLPLSFDEARIDTVVRAAVRDATPVAQSLGISVEMSPGVPELVVVGDELRLRQVFDNLLSNALKYSEAGSVVRVEARRRGDRVEVDVIDSGRGVAPEDKERIFTSFVRADVRDDRDTGGLGLGLAISARIVEAHGGDITVHDNPQGRGSIFRVCLPVAGASGHAIGETRFRVLDT